MTQGIKYPTGAKLMERAADLANEWAKQGLTEHGGNNRGYQIEKWLRIFALPAGSPWCAAFLCGVILKAFSQLTGQTYDFPKLVGYLPGVSSRYLTLSPSCDFMLSMAKARKLTIPLESEIRKGDLLFYDFAKVGAAHHIGICWSASSDRIISIEGNTPASSPHLEGAPDGVYLKMRTRDSIIGIVRLES